MSVTESELRARNLRTLALLASLFVLPLLIAFWAYYGTGWRPAHHVNHGELIAPARPLPPAELERGLPGEAAASAQETGPLFRKKWWLVYVGDGQCDAECRHSLYVMRQTRLSLNNEMTRVERVFLVTGSCCDADFLGREHSGTRVLDTRGAAGSRLLAAFPADGREHTLFIVDPLGNLMMRYDARQNPKGLLEDLKKLLALSHIG